MKFIELNMCEGKKYCLVIIDPYTGWIAIFPTAKTDAIALAKVLCKEIIPRFGIPKVLWSDHTFCLNNHQDRSSVRY